MTTNNPTAVAYAKQRGVRTHPGSSLSTEGTVADLYDRAKTAGLKVTTKMRKADLVKMIEHNNRCVSSNERVDISKLTPRQRRRLRKRGVS